MQAFSLLLALLLALIEPHQLVPAYEDTDCDTAYTTCSDSQLCFDTDNNRLYVCESNSWTPVDQLYDVLTTKGDVIVYSTAPTRLAVGTNDYYMMADSTQSEGVAWGEIKNGSASTDPDSCAANSTCTFSWYVAGMGSGHMCLCWANPVVDDDLLQLGGCRTISDYVQVHFYNPTGGAIDAGSSTLYYRCWGQ